MHDLRPLFVLTGLYVCSRVVNGAHQQYQWLLREGLERMVVW